LARLADNRRVIGLGRRQVFWSWFVIFAGVVAGCARGAQRDQPLSTLESARKVHYAIAADVAGDANSLGLPGITAQLRQWVAQYMAQVGLALVKDAPGPHDVELHLSLSARGGTVLLYGTAGMAAMTNGQPLDQWTTTEHVEPASGFARALARDLVEALVHSQRLAAHADAGPAIGAGSSPSAAPVNGVVIPVVALSTSPAPSPGPAAAIPAAASTLVAAPAQSSGTSTSGARAHARQGQAFYDLNRFQQAFQEYEQAYLIEQEPALLYNMGQCQRKLGNNEEALHFYRTYLRRVPKGPSAIEAEKHVRELVAGAR
jgi:tetratricopeptide (TPR) repeat protein